MAEPVIEVEDFEDSNKPVKYGWRFWAVFPGLCIASLLSSLEVSALSTVMPTIANDLKSSTDTVWAIDTYFVAQTAMQPLYGQMANIFGRRWLLIQAVALFALGSGLCGGADSIGMLIVGRTVQGIGGGGINVLIEIIVGDLVPLRERPKFMGVVMGVFALGNFIGPVIGGVIATRTTWRWVFWLNLPVAGAALVLLALFLQVKYDRSTSVWAKLKRVDFIGNTLLVGSIISILLPLTWAGTVRPWSSWRTIFPLILGFAGLIAFLFYENSGWVAEQTMPLRLFSNRTSALAFIMTFFHGTVLFWVAYFMPLYFQAVLEHSPQHAGVDFLASAIPLVPTGIISGVLISILGKYRPSTIFGFVIMTLGTGLFIMLDDKSKTAVWVVFQIIFAAGSGFIITALVPAVLSPLPESDLATATATMGFIRGFGTMWGVAIPTAVFNTQFNHLLYQITDESVRALLANGGAYQRATKAFLESLNSIPLVKAEVIGVYVASLQRVWTVGVVFSAIGIPLSFFIKEIQMRTEKENEYGLTDEKENEKEAK
ncbi:major facilitator superfamily-domain-containing protein [Lipomyces kononenkoae]|uniref:Major facilitator superfamily-domain-containing protein n=1 Tax=Lipomyces kononenkoae TaxID=34357 RepID=A0ACC3SRW0_LIPKO